MRDVLVVGGGLAGFRSAQTLRDVGYGGRLTILSEEAHAPYDRPPLSKRFLAGACGVDDCGLPGESPDVEWRLSTCATGLDRVRRIVTLDDGEELSYDGLVIATGRRARPWPGSLPARGVHTIRTLEDATAFRSSVEPTSQVVIIGAGFIGCEVAATLRAMGVGVTVVDVATHPMPALGPAVGVRAVALHEAHGVEFRLGRGVAGLEGTDRVTGVRLEDGEVLPATVVLVAVGSVPNSDWLGSAGLSLRAGAVECDTTCSVIDAEGNVVPEIVAAGDIAAWPHPHAGSAVCIEHWSNARDMADTAARNLLRPVAEREALPALALVPTFWSDQYDVKIKSAGFLRAADSWTVVAEDAERRSLLAEGRRGDELVAAVAFNMNRSIIRYHRMLGTPVPVAG